MKKVTVVLGTILSLFSLFYYTVHYYQDGELVLRWDNFYSWIAFVVVTSTLLLVGLFTLFGVESIKVKYENLESQNLELKEMISKLTDKTIVFASKSEDDHDEIYEMVLNSRELMIDIAQKNNSEENS